MFSGLDEAVLKNIEACKQLSLLTKTSMGPNGAGSPTLATTFRHHRQVGRSRKCLDSTLISSAQHVSHSRARHQSLGTRALARVSLCSRPNSQRSRPKQVETGSEAYVLGMRMLLSGRCPCLTHYCLL